MSNLNGSKSMEKLSSGFRINRAGDDAAGLAISEKMRAQVRGLNQASRNSQDAISLIQTAEGALSETHSILQRMRELAVQAANDTNVNVDRDEIQKEINQLTSEINRIGNTTEFNTMKLLDGTVKVGTGNLLGTAGNAPSYVGSSLANVTVAAGGNPELGTYEAKIENLGGQASFDVSSNQLVGGASNGEVLGTDTLLAAGSYKVVVTEENAKTTSAVTVDTGINDAKDLTVTANSTLVNGDYQVHIQKETTPTVTPLNTAGLSDLQLGAGGVKPADGVYAVTTSAIAKTFVDDADVLADGILSNIKLAENSTFAEIGLGASIKIEGAADTNQWTVSLINDTGGVGEAVVGSVTFTASLSDGVQQIKVGDLTMNVDFAALKTSAGVGNTEDSTYDGASITFDIGRAVTITNLTDATKTATADVSAGGNDIEFALANSGGKFTLDAVAANGVTPGQTINVTVNTTTEYKATLQTDAGGAVAGSNIVTLTAAQMADPTQYKNVNLGNGVLVNLDAAALTAPLQADGAWNTTFTVGTALSKIAELQQADGTALTAKFTLNTAGGSENAVQALGTTGANFKYNTGGDNTVTAGQYVFTVAENTTADDFRISLTKTHDGAGDADGTVLINQQAVNPNATVNLGNGVTVNTAVNMVHNNTATYKILSGAVDNSLSMQVGANQGQSFSVDIEDMRATALGISGVAQNSVANGIGGNSASGSFVNTAANVTNGTNNVADEFALDVSSHTKASAAVEVINQALEAVSAERSKLGAFQNRLEHTISNLGTSSENLQAAESRIRDVDMAAEMMEFTKNNILQQAATAMLAQANQAPQSVLQLLG